MSVVSHSYFASFVKKNFPVFMELNGWHNRYVRSLPANQGFNVLPFNSQKIQLPFVQYDTVFPQLGQIPRAQATLGYRPHVNPVMRPFCAMGSNQTSRDAAYIQWPSAAMMYAHSYEQFRHATFQVGCNPILLFLLDHDLLPSQFDHIIYNAFVSLTHRARLF